MSIGAGGFPGGDVSAGVDRVAGSEVDLKKLVRKPAEIPVAETAVSGATHESIAAFVASTATSHDVDPQPGGTSRIRTFLRRWRTK